ncbi:MAG: NADH:ubiquinone oxidoreductase subunit NDUFA12 [Methylobacteriaceae bacterium]|nr:NADH:ubiquinone oxidoreductase subunit NDUFA12 [Methylobacteriaceae bacterium]
MKELLLQIFTWWHGQTIGTRVFTWRRGRYVGSDEFGNKYYQCSWNEIDPSIGPRRRWVVYNGPVEASRVPPGWRAWLCYTVEKSPAEEEYKPHDWEIPYQPNMTGTTLAYHPEGSMLGSGRRPPATGDYVPWQPN